jgi:amino acid adenylation domain-containing protein
MITLQNNDTAHIHMADLQTELLPLPRTTAKFDLSFEFTEHDSDRGISGCVEYRADLFDAETVRRWTGYLVRVLSGAVADPDRPVSRLPLLGDAEHELVLSGWNDTAYDHTVGLGLHELFSAQAARTPRAVAVRHRGDEYTYARLDAAANQLAGRLRAAGVRTGDIVAIVQERSINLVASLLAVLKAGGAYLPIDTDYPRERQAFMVGDAGARAVLGDAPIDGLPAPVLPVGEHLWPEPSASSPPVPAARGAAPAYLIYTSGSTGNPKGVLVPHAGIVNRLLWMQHAYRLTPRDRVLQKTPYGFDVSVWEFFWPLITGATLVMADPDGHRDPAYLAKLIQREEISTVHFVPSMLTEFLAVPAASGCSSVERLVCSGEALTPELVRRAAEVLPAAAMHNLYGPTEASVDVTYHRCEPVPGATSVPIGRPVWNTRTYVLDARLHPVPPGVRGDLYLAGTQLALGYLGRPGLTAERFTADPYGPPGSRMYRTGDLARWTTEGVLEFDGRVDHQIKIRGVRIELGEIEAALRALPDVNDAVVVKWEPTPGEPALAGYVTGAGHDVQRLRAALAERLPAHLVPSVLVVLDRIPRSANGKTDRKALPHPRAALGAGADAATAPRTELEDIVARAWQEVLPAASVDVHGDFFALGGHSLLAMRLVGRLRTALDLDLSVKTIFDHPTIAALATVIEQALLSDLAEVDHAGSEGSSQS